jgi:hypothetical protein
MNKFILVLLTLLVFAVVVFFTNRVSRFDELKKLSAISKIKLNAINRGMQMAMEEPETRSEINSMLEDSTLSDREIERLKCILTGKKFVFIGKNLDNSESIFCDPLGRPYVFTLSNENGGGITIR